jgi:hypothetical protein
LPIYKTNVLAVGNKLEKGKRKCLWQRDEAQISPKKKKKINVVQMNNLKADL